MLPDSVLNNLHADAATAVMLAVGGDVRDGMEILLAGLRRTEALATDEAWAEELSARYRKAIDGYSRRFGCNPLLLQDLHEFTGAVSAR